MCVIIVAHRARPSADLLLRAMQQNPHGNGIAWRDGGIVRWRKGLSNAEALKVAAEVPLPFVFHARIATVGGACKQLTHPFPIERSPVTALSGAAPSVLFHNGHVSEWRAIAAAAGLRLPPDARGWSDSRAMAHAVATAKRFDVLRELADMNRFAVLASKSLRTFGKWIPEGDGILLSTWVSQGTFLRDWSWKDPEESIVSRSSVVVEELGVRRPIGTLAPAPAPIVKLEPEPQILTPHEADKLTEWLDANATALGAEDVADLRQQIEAQTRSTIND